MSDAKALSDRIDVLEMRLTFQDEAIETLNKTITAQWLKIDALTRQVADLSPPARSRGSCAWRCQRTAAALLKRSRSEDRASQPIPQKTTASIRRPFDRMRSMADQRSMITVLRSRS
jgi:SlyX protein